jgi:MtN3 and saliva related transmembrane protein
MIEVLGILAGCLTTLCWVPQLLRTWRRRSAEDISGMYLFTLGTGVAGWIVYGVLKVDIAVIFANVVTLTLLICLAGMKYGRTPAAQLPDRQEGTSERRTRTSVGPRPSFRGESSRAETPG